MEFKKIYGINNIKWSFTHS